jgi:hypothetical protein
MNGFITFTDAAASSRVKASRIVPTGVGDVRDEAPDRAARLITWGNGSGDVHTVTSGNQSWLVLSGYLLDIQGEPGFRNQADAAGLLLGLLDESRSDEEIERLAARVTGSFGILYRNASRDVTLCVTDRIASRPLWTAWSGGGWVISSHSMAVALSNRAPDIDSTALGSFLLYGGSIEPTRSFFSDIKGVPAGTIVRLSSGGASDLHAWYAFRHAPDEALDIAAWTDLVADRLVGAAARLAAGGEKLAVFFSGGVDSRLTAAALKSAGADPLLVTLADSRNIEVRVATAAARALGLRHEVVFRDELWYQRALPRAVYEAGAGYVFTHGHFSAAARQVREKHGIDAFMLGDLGEAFSKLFCSTNGVGGRLWTPEEFVDGFDSARLPLYRPPDRTGTLSLLNQDVRADVEAGVRREILDRYRRVSSVSQDPLIVGDYCFRWESAGTLPTFFMFGDLRSAAAERNIMFDPAVHDVLERLPSGIRSRHNFGAQVIRRLQPRAAWVPNSNSLLPIWWPTRAHKMSRRIKPVLGRIRRALVGQSHRTTGSWPEHAALYLSHPRWRQLFREVLSNQDLFEDRIFDQDAVTRCWTAFLDGDHRRSADVEKLLQIGLTRRLIIEGPSGIRRAPGSSDPRFRTLAHP